MAILINQENKPLNEELKDLISRSYELNFLVGFFYFSGFEVIAESIERNQVIKKIKILVGLEVDEFNNEIIEIGKSYAEKTDKEIKKSILDSLRKSFKSDACDTKEFYYQTKLFLELFQKSILEIRKTREPNHSKLYLFKLLNNRPNIIAIMGSSNLTKPGLTKQNELNVEIMEEGHTQKLDAYFNAQWDNSVSLNDEQTKHEIIRTIEHHSPIKSITPFEAFIYILYLYQQSNYLDPTNDRTLETFLKGKNYQPFKYQMDAVYQACKILEVHHGVILADVVGLGKSIIACLIAKLLKVRGMVIAPPGLIGDTTLKTSGWAKYLNDFELFGWEIFSSGKLEDALKRAHSENFEVVIIDEAHKFRNESTDSYAYLQSICRGKKVILLTATPFNNRPSDVFAYLKLFTIPKQSTLVLNGDLETQFKGLEKRFEMLTRILKRNDKKSQEYYAMLFPHEQQIDPKKVRNALKTLSQNIKKIIEPIVIRRNRLDLQNDPYYKNEIKEFPTVLPPVECFYALDKNLNDFYDQIIGKYFSENGHFKGAIYRPDRYKKKKNTSSETEKTPQHNLYDFMRRLLVKRFESSFFAFRKSIENFIGIYQKVDEFIKNTQRYILNRKVMDEILDEDLSEVDDADIHQLIEKLLNEKEAGEKEIYLLEEMNEHFIDDLQSDISLFRELAEQLNTLNCFKHNDPKIAELKLQLNKILANNQKAIIFTEYVDTANYIFENLDSDNNIRALLVTSKPSRELYEKILSNFDASYPVEKQKNDFDVLVVTDRFSEGYNLNRANHVFNFDIPWNPVRVIQRVGRINRIGNMPFKQLFIYNFFPTKKGEAEINLRKIAETKMFTIHQCLGEDAKIFSDDEQPTPSELYQRLNANPDELNQDTSLITKIRTILKEHEQTLEKVKDLPRYIKVAKGFQEDNMVMAIKRANALYFFTNTHTHQPNALEEVWSSIECTPDEPLRNLSIQFWDNYYHLKHNYDVYLKNAAVPSDLTTKSSNDNLSKSISILRQLLRENPHWLSDENKQLLDDMLNDLLQFGTIPKAILSDIANWKPDKPNEPLPQDKILKDLQEFQKLLGKDLIKQLQQQTQEIKNEIIICIENQKV